MISFIWPPGELMLAGTGGSETYTAGHVRELLRRGIKTQVVIIGVKLPDNLKGFEDIPFKVLKSIDDISSLEGTVIFVNNICNVTTKNKPAMIVHNALPNIVQEAAYDKEATLHARIIATSVSSAQKWALYLKIPSRKIRVVKPFADPIFGQTKRISLSDAPRIVYAGRLHPEKGIYVLLEALHMQAIVGRGRDWKVSIIEAGINVEAGQTLARMLRHYPYAQVIPARKTVQKMATLLASNDILVMPSTFAEPFGMLSVEAQHAGCRVVASNYGGLPETNCGLLTVVRRRDPQSLLDGIEKAIALGGATEQERRIANNYFTLKDSVDLLLKAIEHQP